jgi:tetratricopeptide (TPR) repeat protein
VLELQPNYSNALYSIGLLYETRGDKATALKYYYKVKDLNPNNQDILNKIKSLMGGAPAQTSQTINKK